MSESLKFGPEWLRNSIATSPPAQEDTISRPILSEYHYSREEMLSLCEEKNFKPDPFTTYTKMFQEQWQTPLTFQPEEKEREKPPLGGNARLFINSNVKNGNWRKGQMPDCAEMKASSENWRAQKDSGGTGVFYNNVYNEQQPNRKMSWRNPENTIENLLEQQKSPPLKYPEGPIVTNKSPSTFISPLNKEYIEYHQQSQDNVKNYLENRNNLSSPPSMIAAGNGGAAGIIGSLEMPGEKIPSTSGARSKHADKEAVENIDLNMRQLEMDLVKNLTELVISSEKDFNKAGPPPPPPEPIARAAPAPVNNRFEKPPIMWLYVDPFGKVQGPFSEEEMSHWYKQNYFHDALLVKRSIDTNFLPLGTLIKIFGSAHPFTVASNYFPIPRVENYFDQFHPSQSVQPSPPPVPPSMMHHQKLQQQQQFNNFDPFNQLNFMQQQQQQPSPQQMPAQLHMNFLAQPFPTINKAPLPPTTSMPIDRRSMMGNVNKTNVVNPFSQMQQQIVVGPPPPPIGNPMAGNGMNPINFPRPSLAPASTMKPFMNSNQMQALSQMPRPMDINGGGGQIGMESIQRMLFDIQKQHEMQVKQQQQMNFFQQQQQQQLQMPLQSASQAFMNPPSASAHNNNNNNNNTRNNDEIPTTDKRLSFENKKDLMNFDADDEDDFQTVENPRRKRFQKEEANEAPEKANAYGDCEHLNAAAVAPPNVACEPNKAPAARKVASSTEEEKSTQPAMPAPWFKNVVVSQSDDKSTNNIEFTFADQNNVRPVAWPKITAATSNESKGSKKSHGEEKSAATPATMPAPWSGKSAAAEKSLKKIQIEEEEVRQIQQQMQREKELQKKKKEQEQQSKPMWKPIPVGGFEKRDDPLFPGFEESIATAASSSKDGHKCMEMSAIGMGRGLENWCIDTLTRMNIANIDIHAFSSFLQSIESPFEVEDYIKVYLGDNQQSNEFLKRFLRFRCQCHAMIACKPHTDDLCAPAKAINPISSSSSATSIVNEDGVRIKNNKKKTKDTAKKSKKFVKVLDTNILGFKGAADPNRIVGEIEVFGNYTHLDD